MKKVINFQENQKKVLQISQTSLLNKIFCFILYANFAFTLEILNFITQKQNERNFSDKISKFSHNSFNEFFGPAGFLLDFIFIGFGLTETLEPKYFENKNKKLLFALLVSSLVVASYLQRIFSNRFNNNIIFNAVIIAISSAILMVLKVYLKIVIISISEDYNKNEKSKKSFIIGAILLSMTSLYLKYYIETYGIFEDNIFLQICSSEILNFFCYSILFELFIYYVFLDDLINEKEHAIKKKMPELLVKKNNDKYESTLLGKFLYIVFLFILNFVFLSLLFILENYDVLKKVFSLVQKIPILNNEFFLLNLQELISAIISLGLIYSATNIGPAILSLVEDLSLKNKNQNLPKDCESAKNNFIFYLITYTLLAPICLGLNFFAASLVLFKIISYENDFTKIFHFDKKFLPAYMTVLFIFASFCAGILNFLSSEIQENAVVYIDERDNNKSKTMIDKIAEVFYISEPNLGIS